MSAFEFYGRPARLKIELDLGGGRTASVDVSDSVNILGPPRGGHGYSSIHIPIQGSIEARVQGVLDECAFRGIE